jgi:hypothetical protein
MRYLLLPLKKRDLDMSRWPLGKGILCPAS